MESSKQLMFFLAVIGFSASLASLASAEDLHPGQEAYVRLCAQCHGLNGTPPAHAAGLLSPPPPDLAAGPYKYGDSLEEIRETIGRGLGTSMFRFDNRLSSEQIDAVARYVMQLRAGKKAASSK